jgi:hypothetical protein
MKNSLAPLQLELLPKRLAKGDWNARREPAKQDRRRAAVLLPSVALAAMPRSSPPWDVLSS